MYIQVIMKPPALDCACATIRRASRLLTRMYEEELGSLGVTVTQFTVLRTLERRPGLTQSNLAALHGLDESTLTRTLGLSRTNGWVKPRPGADRRSRRWHLTREGRRLLKRGRAPWNRAQYRIKKALGEKDWNRLFESLDRVSAAVPEA